MISTNLCYFYDDQNFCLFCLKAPCLTWKVYQVYNAGWKEQNDGVEITGIYVRNLSQEKGDKVSELVQLQSGEYLLDISKSLSLEDANYLNVNNATQQAQLQGEQNDLALQEERLFKSAKLNQKNVTQQQQAHLQEEQKNVAQEDISSFNYAKLDNFTDLSGINNKNSSKDSSEGNKANQSLINAMKAKKCGFPKCQNQGQFKSGFCDECLKKLKEKQYDYSEFFYEDNDKITFIINHNKLIKIFPKKMTKTKKMKIKKIKTLDQIQEENE